MVRDATPLDADAVAGLLTQLGYPTSEVKAAERLAILADHPGARVLVADSPQGVVGVVSFQVIPLLAEGGSFARITALAVDPDQWRKGSARSCSLLSKTAPATPAAPWWKCRAVDGPNATPPTPSTAVMATRTSPTDLPATGSDSTVRAESRPSANHSWQARAGSDAPGVSLRRRGGHKPLITVRAREERLSLRAYPRLRRLFFHHARRAHVHRRSQASQGHANTLSACALGIVGALAPPAASCHILARDGP